MPRASESQLPQKAAVPTRSSALTFCANCRHGEESKFEPTGLSLVTYAK
jgi:hypothetical protein